MDAAVLGDRLPEGTKKPLLGPGSPLFAAPALRARERACRVCISWDAVTAPMVCFSGVLWGSPEWVSSSLRPKPSVHLLGIDSLCSAEEHLNFLRGGPVWDRPAPGNVCHSYKTVSENVIQPNPCQERAKSAWAKGCRLPMLQKHKFKLWEACQSLTTGLS